jgi:hypothetical protein
MSGIRIEGNTSGNVAEVDDNNDLFVNLPTVINNAGYVAAVHEVDSGSITGTALRRTGYVSHDLRQRVGLDTAIFDYFFTATAQDTNIWKCAIVSAMTAAQSGGFLLLNSTPTLTSGAGISLSTWRVFALEARGGLHVRIDALMTATPLTNQVNEFGLFLPTTSTAPADGVYWRITSAGVQGVVNYNGTETSTGVVDASPPIGSTNTYSFEVYAGGVEFYINGILYNQLMTPGGDSEPFISVALPLTIQTRNSGTVSGSTVMQFKVGSCHVDFLEVQTAMPYSHQQAAEGLTGQQATQGSIGSTQLYTANLAAGAGVTITGTTATGLVGLGGQFSIVPAIANAADGIVCSYQVPIGTTSIPARMLMITGIKITTMVMTTLTTTGPIYYAYALCFGHTALSLATAETGSFVTATAKAPRRVALGFESFTTNAPLGTMGSTNGVYMPFNSPIAVNPGEYVAISAKNLNTATAPTAGVITFLITYDAYWI